jgi:hypothetical protein
MSKAFAILAAGFAVYAQTQPIPYSHKTHLALGLECKTCHKNPDPGELMGLPAASVCMGCHQSVKTESPHIQKLAEAAKENKPIPWVRVYQIPTYVFFSHRAHTQASATCEGCHGPVRERDVITKDVVHKRGSCMVCHRKSMASNDCTYCHEQRN